MLEKILNRIVVPLYSPRVEKYGKESNVWK